MMNIFYREHEHARLQGTATLNLFFIFLLLILEHYNLVLEIRLDSKCSHSLSQTLIIRNFWLHRG